MDCKVIYGFDLSLSKTFHCLLFFFSQRVQNIVGNFCERGFGKDDLREGVVFLEVVFMVNNTVSFYVSVICT